MSYLTVNCRSNKVLFFNPGLCRLKLLDPFFASHLGIKQTNQIHILPHQKKKKNLRRNLDHRLVIKVIKCNLLKEIE